MTRKQHEARARVWNVCAYNLGLGSPMENRIDQEQREAIAGLCRHYARCCQAEADKRRRPYFKKKIT